MLPFFLRMVSAMSLPIAFFLGVLQI